MEIARFKNGIFVSQKDTIDLLKETEFLGCKPIDTPIYQNHKLGATSNATTVDKSRLKLIHLSHTWPNISFDVNVIS